jgi:short subunit dehydrogenase-like uncharacterized protein
MSAKITVFGATGYTGQLIVAELQRLKLPFNIGGRSTLRLAQMAQRLQLGEEVAQIVADPLQPATLPALFRYDTRILVNCSGPFTRFGEPVVKAAVETGTHYLDITGEQNFIVRVFDQYGLAASLKQCALIPACGVEYALTNWLATLVAAKLEPLDRISTVTNVLRIQATSGTSLSLFQALAAPGFSWEDGHRVRRLAGSQLRIFDFPSGRRSTIWSPFGDMVTLPTHLQVKNVASYIALGPVAARTTHLLAPLLPTLSKLVNPVLSRLLRSGRGPTLKERQQAQWEMLALAESPKGSCRATLKAGDAYGLTAHIVGYCAEKLLSPDFKQVGALGPAQAFEAQAALEYLGDFGLTFAVKML